MKTLKNNVLLYDSHCPMCKAYTGAFVTCGLLDNNGRSAYNEKDARLFAHIDQQKARNEIALVDLEHRTVAYGLDSLIKILGHDRPLVRSVLNFPLVYYPAKFLYSLVSYNRKLIAPSKSKQDDCVPDFNLFYRLLFLLLTSLFTGWVLYRFITPVLQHSGWHTSPWQETAIVSGQIIFQSLVFLVWRRKNIFDYLGNMMTVSTIGALLLLPALFFYSVAGFNLQWALVWFAAVVGTMFLLHLKRCKRLGLGIDISASWVLYRVLVLIFILQLS